jgi:hypothetical protein
MNRREALTAMAVGGVASTATADEPKNPDAAHLAFVEECAKDIRKLVRSIKTRAELLEKFKPAGGLYNRTIQSFSYRRCPWFKVSVTFDAPKDGSKGEPMDKIEKFSTPYLDDPFAE